MAEFRQINNKQIIIGKADNPLIRQLLEWIPRQRATEGLQLVACNCVTVQNGRYVVRRDDSNVWNTEINFARTTRSVVRYFMLIASRIDTLYNPNFSTRDANKRNIEKRPNPLRDINCQPSLASNEDEARAIAENFDRLFPDRVIESMARSVTPFQHHPLCEQTQMAIIDKDNQIIWWFIGILSIEREVQRRAGSHTMRAVPEINVYRFEYEKKDPNRDMGLQFTDRYEKRSQDDEDDDDSADLELTPEEEIRLKFEQLTLRSSVKNKK